MPEHRPITIEELTTRDAFEARMHFLLPRGGHEIRRTIVDEPTATAIHKYMAAAPSAVGVLFWSEFWRYEALGPVPHDPKKLLTQAHRVATHVLASQPYDPDTEDGFTDYDGAYPNHIAITSYTALLAALYARGRERDQTGQYIRPIEPIAQLYEHQLLRPSSVPDLAGTFRSEVLPERYARLGNEVVRRFAGSQSVLDAMGVELNPNPASIAASLAYNQAS